MCVPERGELGLSESGLKILLSYFCLFIKVIRITEIEFPQTPDFQGVFQKEETEGYPNLASTYSCHVFSYFLENIKVTLKSLFLD